ncbi:MAG: TonB-dependent receptor [Saprospiraceae bacterium]|nr:TonB-dependent receptor [Saprospiraceae bacterium]MCB9328707.1 TonB-dependent receptor [Lewinellaceae bacterium]
MRTIYTLLLCILFTYSLSAQSMLTGTVVDDNSNDPLIGASVYIQSLSLGTITDVNGMFKLQGVKVGTHEVEVSYVGYQTMKVMVTVNGNNVDMGYLKLNSGGLGLDEVVVTGVIDFARDRKTPVAVSTIKASEIALKSGNQEFPEIMKLTPSVFTSKSGGGFGDSRMNLRGFDQSNTAFLINGQPINGMEDGKMYWSNWQGVLDVANAIQVQRGLGSSKLAISSVGGTINIVTKTIDSKKGGFVQTMLGNNGYQKQSAYYSTGLSSSGWAFSALLGNWSGNGYNDYMSGSGQTYFASVGYVPNASHSFNFLVTGAPQRHYQRDRYTIQTYLDKGANSQEDPLNPEPYTRFNNSWGSLDGEFYNTGGNYYHKPIMNLSWDWTIDNASSLSTVVYGSWGRGGSIGMRSYAWQGSNYYELDSVYAYNTSIADGVGHRKGGPTDIIRSSVNEHSWFGIVSNYGRKINENISFNIGFDGRRYHGEHYRRVVNFLGLKGWDDDTNNVQLGNDYVVTEAYSTDPWAATFHNTPRNQRIGYDNPENIRYMGGFGQLEYSNNNLSAFVQGAYSTQSNQRFDYFNYDADNISSEKVVNSGYNVKVGANYNINEQNNVFINAGKYSRQPFQDNMFLNFRNNVNPLLTNENITGIEVGYGYRAEKAAFNLNVYRTEWADRVLSGSLSADDGFYQYQGVTQLHMGVELDFNVKPADNFMVKGFASIGDWKYSGNATQTVYDADLNVVSDGDPLYLDGVKVGDAAQTTFGLGLRYDATERLSFDTDWNSYNNLYAGFLPTDSEFRTADNRGSVKLPSFNLIDLGATYKWKISDSNTLTFRMNINNLFDKTYIAESLTNKHAETGVATYDGLNVNNQVYFGFGRTWNFSTRLSF